jgi:hypothetical protein
MLLCQRASMRVILTWQKRSIEMIRRPAKRQLKPQCEPAPSIALTPAEIEHRYRVSNTTRQRWEREGKLPKRDFFLGGKAKGWMLTTIEKAERGENAAA